MPTPRRKPQATRPLAAVAGAACLLLAACGQPAEGDGAEVRIELTPAAAAAAPVAAPAPMPAPQMSASPGAPRPWRLDPVTRTAWITDDNGQPLLSLACQGMAENAPRIVVTRHAPGERGGQALFAVQGNRRILRLPVSVVTAGQWRGELPAGDERAVVFLAGPMSATLPGGGRLELAELGAARTVVEDCRASPRAPAAASDAAYSLP